MIDNKLKRLLDVPMNALTMEQTVEIIRGRLNDGEFTQHAVVNVAKLVHMQTDVELVNSVTSCDIVNIDGMGVVWGQSFWVLIFLNVLLVWICFIVCSI